MKVLYLNHGVTNYMNASLEKVCNKGVEIVMLLPEGDNGTIGKGVYLVDHAKVSYKIRYSKSVKQWYGKEALVDLKQILLEEHPDILLVGWPYFLQLFFDRTLLKIVRKNNIKLIIYEIPFQTAPFKQLDYYRTHPVYNENMELQSKGFLFKIRMLFLMYIRKFVYKHCDATLNYTTYAYDILPSYGVDPESIFVRYNSTDTDALFAVRSQVENSERILDNVPHVLHIGRLVKWKRVDLLIDAFKLVQQQVPDSKLVIIGDGPEKENLIDQAQSLGLSNQIVFTGAVHDPLTLGKYMYASTVYVLAGMGGLSINDAMTYSLPVICSVCDGTEKDLVTDGVNGFFFKEGDVNDLAAKIIHILSDNELAQKMGEASLDIIKNKININTVAQCYIDAFEYVMKR